MEEDDQLPYVEETDRQRLDAEWTALNAVRELLQLAHRNGEAVTYEESLALARELSPKLFDPEKSLISQGQEPPQIREFRQTAEAESILQNRKVKPEEIIDREIEAVQRLLKAPGRSKELRRKKDRLRKYRQHFAGKNYTEHQLIRRDVFQAERPRLPNPIKGDNFLEYKIGRESALRIRMLHPDKPEHSTGADVIYELCSQNDMSARIIFLQYKIWDEDRLYLSSAGSVDKQLDRLSATLCAQGWCAPADKVAPTNSFRFPHCAAFLRLTDRLQSPDARLVSTGVHVPVCIVRSAIEENGPRNRVLRRKDFDGRGVSAKVFEELFTTGMLGSDAIPYGKLESLYREHSILNADERIVIYAQEYGSS